MASRRARAMRIQDMTLRQLLENDLRTRPERAAILAPGRAPMTRGVLAAQCRAVSEELRLRGLAPGCRMGLVLESGPECAVALTALTLHGQIVPLNPSFTEAEALRVFPSLALDGVVLARKDDHGSRRAARALGIPIIEIAASGHAAAGGFEIAAAGRTPVPRISRRPDAGIAHTLLTSGTTALPKQVSITQVGAGRRMRDIAAALRLGPADVYLNVMPLHHSTGLGLLFATLCSGGAVFCTPGPNPELFVAWLRESRATWYTASPAMHKALLESGIRGAPRDALGQLRFVRSANAPLSPGLRADLEAALGVPVIQAYGLTETGLLACEPLPPRRRKPGSVGVSVGPELAILDPDGAICPPGTIGQIAAREPTARGLGPHSQGSLEDGVWLRTGDEGYMDEEGYLFVVGRREDMINRGGQKVSPAEIEATVGSHADVAEVVAFSVPDERLGEVPAAAVVPRAGRSVTSATLREFARTLLAEYKVPHHILLIDRIPTNALGKVDRRRLAACLLETRTAPRSSRADGGHPEEGTLEHWMLGIWRQVLRLEEVGLDEDFLGLGGDSIRGMMISNRIAERFGVWIPVAGFLGGLTVRQLCAQVREALEKVSPAR